MKIEYKLMTVDKDNHIDTVWFNDSHKASMEIYKTRRNYDISGARLTEHVTCGDHVRAYVKLIDEWGGYIPQDDTKHYLIPADILLSELRTLRDYFRGCRFVSRKIKRPTYRRLPAILDSEIRGVSHILEIRHYDEEKDFCTFSYILYLAKGEDPDNYIIPDTVYQDVTIRPYEEWLEKRSIGRDAFRDATGYNYQF